MPEQTQGGENVTITSADVGELKIVDPHAPHAGKKAVVDQPIFCANCQAVTTHKMSVHHDRNCHHELLSTCDCGRALKFPEHMIDDRAAFEEHLKAHHKSNVRQISAIQAQADMDAYDERFLKMMGSK